MNRIGRALPVLLGIAALAGCTSHTLSESTAPQTVPGTVAMAQGGEVSGGADSFFVAPALFRSTDSQARVRVCYEVAANFGVPNAELESMIRSSFELWDTYIESKDLHYAIGTGLAGIVAQLSDTVKQGCHGDEDLRIYFGVENADVTLLRPKFINPYAFSGITQGSSDDLWHKGLLWIAPPGAVDPAKGIPTWTRSGLDQTPFAALKYTVLHEVGHLFGNEHVDYTIMTSRIGQNLESWTDPHSDLSPTASELKIDQGRELVPNLTLAEDFKLASQYGCISSSGSVSCPDTVALAVAFQRIFGQSSQGDLTAVAHRRVLASRRAHGRPNEVTQGTGPVDLEFTDSAGVHRATILTTAIVSEAVLSAVLFDGQHGDHYSSFGVSLQGTLQAEGKPAIPVVVNYNLGGFFTVIDFASGLGLEHPLLQAAE